MFFHLYLFKNRVCFRRRIGVFRSSAGFLKDESGMGTLEVIIIIAVLVALALVFRNFIMDMAGMIFDKIKAKTDATINTL